MAVPVELSVYRRLDNRYQGLPDDSPLALELHNRRKVALHDVFDGETSLSVSGWELVDDSESHELVEMAVGAAASFAFKYAVLPAVKWLGEQLAEKAIDKTGSELAQWLLSKLLPKQETQEIYDFNIKLPDGTYIHCDPPDRDAEVRIIFRDGVVDHFTYAAHIPD